MLKQTKEHTLYEVWSEWAAESVFVDHKPTEEEIVALWEENWPTTPKAPEVFKLEHVYIQDPRQNKTPIHSDPCVPDKNVLVPPYVHSTEGYDPAKCDRLNATAQKQYEAEKLKRMTKL